MADKIKFLAGKLADLANKPKVQGQVYFAIDGETGKIAFDVDGQTRVFMDKASSADSATQDSAGNVISKYIKTIQLLSGDDTRFQYILGDGSYVPSKTTGIRLNFVSRAGDTMTGLLTAKGGILVNTATNTNNFIISRTGSATSECTTFGQNDQGLMIKSINDEASTYIRFDMEATDMEANAGAGANSGTITFELSGGKTTVTADYFSGQASSAVKDTSGNTIASTFIKNLILNNHATQPYYQLVKGTGDNKTTVNLPVASTDYAGVVTVGAQTFAGLKTFNDSIFVNGKVSIANKGNTVEIGADNEGYFHFLVREQATTPLTFWFGGPIQTMGNIIPYGSDTYTLGTSSQRWKGGYFGSEGLTVSGAILDKDSSELRASLFVHSFYVKTNNATELTIGGKNTIGNPITNASVQIPNATTTTAGIVTAGAQAFAGPKTIVHSTTTNARKSSALILSSNSNKPVGLEFWRGDGANCGSWQVVNDSGNLIFRTDYNDGVQTTYSVGSLQLHYTTGAAQAPYVWVNGANSSYRLYVSGAAYLTSTLVLGSTLTLNNGTLNRATSKPLLFQINGSTHARFDASGHFLPEATNTYNMGSSSLYWKNVYATTFNGALKTNNIVLQNAAAAQYGRLYIATEGTACATAGTAGTTGVAMLILGNSTAVSSTAGEGANNARGRIRLYGTGANYIQLQANPKTETNNYTFTLPPYEGNMYAAHTGSTDAVGSGVKPVYVGASGRITASSSTVGSGIKPIYLNAGTLTVSSSTVGSGIIPVFLNAGTLTASTSTIGSGIKPMFLNAGTLTASSSTVGSGVVPMFLSSGTLTASTSTVGSGIKPIYLNAGTLTVSSSTVGTSDRPVYLSSGTISQTTYRMAATNATATSGVDIGSTPQTGIWYVTGTSGILSQSDGVAIVNHYNSNWVSQIYQDYRTGQIALRGKNNGTWQSWRTVIDTGNYATHLDGRYVNVTGDTITGGIDLSAVPSASTSYKMGTTSGANGGFHFRKKSGTNDWGNAITWAYTENDDAQAGIYVKSSGAYGTRMYFATTNLFADGAKAALEINESGSITALRGTFVGNLSGNASSATKVNKALSINGKSFNGSAAVDVGTLGIAYGGTGATNALTAFYNLNYRGAATNCNNNISVGSYYWATNCTNTPVASSYGLLYNFVSTGESHNNTNNWIWQFGFTTSSNDMYLRNKVNNGGWASWVQLLHTGNYTGILDGRYVNVTGDTMTGKLQVNAPIFGYNYSKSNNAAAFIFDKPGSNYTGIGANGSSDTIYFGACNTDGTWNTSYYQIWKFQGALTLETGAGTNNCTKNYISAGRGYSTGSGKNGLKLICTEQTDAISGIGQDCTGKEYELSVGAALGTSGQGYITFVGHKMASLNSYTELGHFNFANSTFYINGKIGIGTTAPSYSLQVEGSSYTKGLLVCNRGTSTTSSNYSDAAIEIREYNFGGAQSDSWGVAPRLSFHWSGRVAAQIGLASNGWLYAANSSHAGTTMSKIMLENGGTWGINISGNAATANSLSGKFYANRMINPNNSGVRTGAPPLSVLGLMNSGYGVYNDPEFASGSNSVSVYNNSGNGTVVHTRVADSTAANTSGYVLKITHSGTASPGWGGFYQNISSRANAVYAQIFRAKIPVGYSVVTASNSMGAGYSDYWITDQAGTGKWEWYCRIVLCGESGSFSGGGHVYLTGGTTPTSSAPVSWYLAYCNLFDLTKGAYLSANRIYGAVWNDYAEFRQADSLEPGRVVIEDCSGQMKLASERLQPGANIISDTYGFAIGETDINQTPIAVSGRVLAYPYEDRNTYPLGAAVCSGPNGTISLMTREEIREYPERIIGTVSEIPNYDEWGGNNAKVNGRIWIKVK